MLRFCPMQRENTSDHFAAIRPLKLNILQWANVKPIFLAIIARVVARKYVDMCVALRLCERPANRVPYIFMASLDLAFSRSSGE
jgi:hypothetical protein